MLKIYVARHGQDIDNQNGILNGQRNEPLSERGIEQAHMLAKKIQESNIRFDTIYSSPLQRAFKTASIVSEIIDGPVPEKEDLLIERDFGVMTGKKTTDIEKLCAPEIIKTEIVTYFLNPDGAETFINLMDRAKIVIEKIKNRHQSGSVLLVCHGDIGKMIYAKYYNLDWREALNGTHFGNCDLILLSENLLAKDAHVFEFKQYNW